MANYAANIKRVYDRDTVPVGTYYHRVSTAGWSDVGMQWINHSGDGAITHTIYSTFEADKDKAPEADPATNPIWRDETPDGAVFPTEPSAVVASDTLTLSDNVFHYILIKTDVTTEVTEFSFIARTQGRRGS